jgi:hypothetical protein
MVIKSKCSRSAGSPPHCTQTSSSLHGDQEQVLTISREPSSLHADVELVRCRACSSPLCVGEVHLVWATCAAVAVQVCAGHTAHLHGVSVWVSAEAFRRESKQNGSLVRNAATVKAPAGWGRGSWQCCCRCKRVCRSVRHRQSRCGASGWMQGAVGHTLLSRGRAGRGAE